MNIVVPMAGSNELFSESGYQFPKNLIELDGKPLVQHVYEKLCSLPNVKFTFLIKEEEKMRYHLDDVLKLINPSSNIIVVEGETSGAACTVLLAIEAINNDEPLLITNGDQIVIADLERIIADFQKSELDGGVVTFESVHPRWSYVLVDEEGLVVETAEKRPISKYATAGIYYFAHGKKYVEACMEMIRKDASVDGKFYVCPAYNEMILKQSKIGIHNIQREQYFSLATPQGVSVYEQYLISNKSRSK